MFAELVDCAIRFLTGADNRNILGVFDCDEDTRRKLELRECLVDVEYVSAVLLAAKDIVVQRLLHLLVPDVCVSNDEFGYVLFGEILERHTTSKEKV